MPDFKGKVAGMPLRRLILALLALLASAWLVPVGSAGASSIVFIKGGDVWLANGDGSGQRALTRNGTRSNPYHSPSQSDRGVVLAMRGRKDLHFIDRSGRGSRRSRDIAGGPTPPFIPVVFDTEISPNGRTVAFTLVLRAPHPRRLGAELGARERAAAPPLSTLVSTLDHPRLPPGVPARRVSTSSA